MTGYYDPETRFYSQEAVYAYAKLYNHFRAINVFVAGISRGSVAFLF